MKRANLEWILRVERTLMHYYEKFTYMGDSWATIFRQKSHKIKVKSLKNPTDARSRKLKVRKSKTTNEQELLRLL